MIHLQVRGKPQNINVTLIGEVIKHPIDSTILLVNPKSNDQATILSSLSPKDRNSKGIFNVDLSNLTPGDIVALSPNGIVNTLFRVDSEDNTLFMTNNCNQSCIMCSQPPLKRNDIEQFYSINNELIDLIPLNTKQIGISGGEPTLYGKYLGLLLSKLTTRMPSLKVSILTNAVQLANDNYFQNLEGIDKSNLLFSVPIYGDNHYTHDSIVQKKGSFFQTIKGIHNLFNYDFRVELRTIPQKRNYQRLEKLSHFIYKNLTFVEQVSFMGIENIGNARKNIDSIWISPKDLVPHLHSAASFLQMSGINCFLFNYQYCFLNDYLRSISLSTISDWKQEYLPECLSCKAKVKCGGIFHSSLLMMKEYIKPL